MNHKLLITIILVMLLFLASQVLAANNGVGVGSATQPTMVNQDQNNQTNQPVNDDPLQEQQRLRDGSEAGNQAQNRNQVNNQGESNQLQTVEQEGLGNKSGSMGEQRRSQVAQAVQAMLQVADRNGGLGEQVRTIAQNQNQNNQKLEAGLQQVQKRGGFTKFLIGADYSEVSKANKILEQNRQQITELNQLKNQLTNQGDQEILTQQIQLLEQANLQIQNSLTTSQKGFSLFGWLVKMFY